MSRGRISPRDVQYADIALGTVQSKYLSDEEAACIDPDPRELCEKTDGLVFFMWTFTAFRVILDSPSILTP